LSRASQAMVRSAMGVRHSPAQQKRLATKTNGRGVDVGSENIQGMDELVDKAGESLSCELSAWLADAEGAHRHHRCDRRRSSGCCAQYLEIRRSISPDLRS